MPLPKRYLVYGLLAGGLALFHLLRGCEPETPEGARPEVRAPGAGTRHALASDAAVEIPSIRLDADARAALSEHLDRLEKLAPEADPFRAEGGGPTHAMEDASSDSSGRVRGEPLRPEGGR